MTPSISAWCLAGAFLGALCPAPAGAQQTRAATIAEEQAEKARASHRYEPSTAERIADRAKDYFVSKRSGLYPWLDSVYSGGGLTLGAGYRLFYGDRTLWYARGLFSTKAYKRFELATDSLGLAGGRVDLRAIGGWRDATQVSFYGVGGNSPEEGRSNFRMQQLYAGGGLRARGPGPLRLDVQSHYEDYRLENGTGSSPSIEDMYTADTAPGLGANPEYIHNTAWAGIDSRPSPGYARRGGLYALSYDHYLDLDDTYTFDRLQAELVQHVPVLRETWVLSFHGVARTTLHDDAVVPYFLLPALGSGSTLRAYPSWRFRDRHSLLLSGEWRWIPNRTFLDVAIFYDAGKVASRRADLNLTGLKHDWGVGVRFHGPLTTPLRVDVARGSEGINVVFSGAAAF